MVTAGVDCGAKTIKVIILHDGKIAGKCILPAGIDTSGGIIKAFQEALKASRLKREDILRIVATGVGKKEARFRDDIATEVSADARGVVHVFPSARIVIDVGAEEGRAIKIDQMGRVLDFAINDKCAAGTGAFTEAMARALEVSIEELGPLSMKSTRNISINAQCAVFAESELVTLLHSRTPKPDMAKAVHDAIAGRIASMVRRVGIEKDVVFVGGVARNIGIVDSLRKELGTEIKVPEEPEFVGAIGAALLAAER